MATKLYLMRHGETLFNTQGRVQGACDSPLTDLGIQQALLVKDYFNENSIWFDSVYSSTQERATDTANLVSGQSQVPQLKGIKEMNFGEFEAQPEFLLPKFRTGANSFEDLLVPFGGEDIVTRHGQTRFNLQGRIQGACDSPLTELGIEQAKSARQHFKEEGITFTRVYSSTQERACDTAEIATGRTDYIRLKGQKEMDFGSYEAHQEYLNPPLHRDDGSGYRDYFVAYGGESNVQVYERMAKTIREVLEQSSDEDQLLFVSHGAAITQFYRHATLNPPVPKKRLANCAIFKMTYDGKDIMVQSIYNPIEKEYIFERKEND